MSIFGAVGRELSARNHRNQETLDCFEENAQRDNTEIPNETAAK
jgi:hypothetical protein